MIDVKDLSFSAGDFSLDHISFTVPEGHYAVLMGRTGSGKTTLLEVLAGLKPIRGGVIVLAGADATSLRPAARGVGYVPQDGALFNTMNVADHLAFALEVHRADKAECAARVEELATLLHLEHLLHRYPRHLSGGERQRVALGRAMSIRPRILLLDEPLSALDEETRDEMISLLKAVRASSPVTVLHVTHNRGEASELADTVLLLRDGRMQTVERPAKG